MTEANKLKTNSENDFLDIRRRLHKAIPGGAHTYSRGDDQFPAIAPPILERGEGAYVYDTHGNKYLDYGMALRAITIGYADPRVNAAAIRQIENGVNLTRASTIELEAAELICETIDSAEMVKFGKNGSNVTTAAVKIARAYTEKKYVCLPRQHPFFSFDDWFIGTTDIKRGVATGQSDTTLVFDYNDIGSLEKLFDEHPGEIAAVILEPTTHITPCGQCSHVKDWPQTACNACPNNSVNFLQQVRRLTTKEGALMILDEMITGFRWHLKGAQHFFGVEPDLSTFGKAMANGFSLAAVTGKREFMEVGSIDRPGMERTFLLSTTHGGEMPALGAFVEATRINREEDVPSHLWNYGDKLREVFQTVTAKHGLENHIEIEGPSTALNYITKGSDGMPSMSMRTLFSQEMLKNNVMMPWISFAQVHGEEELDITADALDKSMINYARALEDGVDNYLDGPAIKPVFRTHN